MKDIFEKYFKYVLFIIFIMVLAIFLIANANFDESSKISDYSEGDILENETHINTLDLSETFFVEVKGEVVKPGVYEVKNTDRIIDVIKLSGGLTKNADTSLLNLSKKVVDEMNIKIYSKKEVETAKNSINKEPVPTVIEIIKEIEKECICPDVNDACINDYVGEESDKEEQIKQLVNINTATKEELLELEGIGNSKADKIIEYRNATPFNKIDDLKNVSGIGDSIFEKIKENITV